MRRAAGADADADASAGGGGDPDRQGPAGTGTVAVAAGVVFAVVAATWFSRGTFYATGDLGPFLRNGAAAEWPALWTHENSGAGGPAYTVVRAGELGFIALARLLGGGEPLAERLLFASMFAFAATGGAALARRFVAHRGLIVLAGILAAANLATLTGLPNYLPVLTIGLVGLSTALGIDAARGRPGRGATLALATVPLSYIALNPPLVAVVLGWLALLPLTAAVLTGTGRRGAARAVALLGRAAPYAAAAHLWWIAPQLLAIGRARAADTIGAQTDVEAWAWTHRNNSLGKVMTLRSAWTWPDVDSHGLAATVLGRPGVAWLTWLLPAGVAVAGLLAVRHRRLVHAVSVACVLTWIVGKGLHPPASGFNAQLYEHVPGFWLLREPMSKVVAIPLLAMVLCWAVGLEALQRRTPVGRLAAMARSGGLALLATGPLLFSWPMITGHVTADSTPGRQEQVVLPEAWRELAADIDGSQRAGKVLVLPLIDFYQVPTTWGFYGTDTLVRGLVRRPVVQRNPQGYLTDLPAYDRLLRATERAVLDGDAPAVLPLLRVLGVGLVLVRHDLDRASPVRTLAVADDRALQRGLAATPGLEPVRSNELGSLFRTAQDVAPVEVLDGLVDFAQWDDHRALVAGLTSLDAAGPGGLTDDARAQAATSLWAGVVGAGDALGVDAARTVEVTRLDPPPLPYRLEVGREPDGAVVLSAVEATPPTLGDRPLRARVAGRWTLGPSELVAVEVDGRVVAIPSDGAPATVTLGGESIVRPLVADAAPALGPWEPVTDCYRYDERDEDEVGISLARLDEDGTPVTRLTAADHRACQRAPLLDVVPGTTYRLRQAVRRVQGAAPSLCLWVSGPDRCLELPPAAAPDASGWQLIDATVTIPSGTVDAALYRYADRPAAAERRGIDDGALTVADYRDPALTRARAEGPVPLDTAVPLAEQVDLAPGHHVLGGGGQAGTIGSWSALEDCHRNDERNFAEAGLSAEAQPDGGVRLAADGHSACVHAELAPTAAGRRVTLTIPYRTVRGQAPRLCLFDRVRQRCLPLTGDVVDGNRLAPAGRGGRAVLDAEATGNALALYVYADGTDGGTVIEYGRPGYHPADAEVVTVTGTDRPGGAGTGAGPQAPAAVVERIDATGSEIRVRVRVDRAGAVLATSEAFDPGWRLHGLPAATAARHVRLDGYRNGWIIDGTGTFELTLRYGQPRAELAFRYGSAALALLLTGRALRARRGRPLGAAATRFS